MGGDYQSNRYGKHGGHTSTGADPRGRCEPKGSPLEEVEDLVGALEEERPCERSERRQDLVPDAPACSRGFSIAASENFPQGEEAAQMLPDRPPTTVPVKKFKRPRSYIHGRVSAHTRGGSGGSGPTRDKLGCLTREVNQNTCCDVIIQDERHQEAVERINALNKRLKAHDFKVAGAGRPPGEEHPTLFLEPDPPGWSYETYSQSERREASLSGLKSYIRANEAHLDESQRSPWPPESLASYLDGVLSERHHPVHRCSMSLEHLRSDSGGEEGEEAEDRPPSPERGHRRHGASYARRGPRRGRERPRGKRGANPHRRPASVDRARRLEHTPGSGGERGTHRPPSAEHTPRPGIESGVEEEEELAAVQAGDKKVRGGHGRREREEKVCRLECGSPQSLNSVSPPLSSSNKRNSPASNNSTPFKEQAISRCEENHRKGGAAKSPHKRLDQDNQRSTRTLLGLGPGGESLSSQVIAQAGGETVGERACGAISLAAPKDLDSLDSVGDLLLQTSGAAPPSLQSQDSPLAVTDGYCLPQFESEGSEAILRDAGQGRQARDKRLVVRKDRASARIWSSAECGEEDEEEDCSYEEDADENDGDDEEETGEIDGGGDSDLIIETELAEGSNIVLSNIRGRLTDIEHGRGTQSEDNEFQVVEYQPDTGKINILNDAILNTSKRTKTHNRSQNNWPNEQSETSCGGEHRSGRPPGGSDDSAVRNKRHNRSSRPDAKRVGHSPPSAKAAATTTVTDMTRQATLRESKRYRNPTSDKSTPRRTGSPTSDKSTPRRPSSPTSDKSTPRRPSSPNSDRSTPRHPSSPAPEARSSLRSAHISPARTPPGLSPDRRGQQEAEGQIEIPVHHDGKARILLVLRTPPKKPKEISLGRGKGPRKSPALRLRSPSPNKAAPKRHTSRESKDGAPPSPRFHSVKSPAGRQAKRSSQETRRQETNDHIEIIRGAESVPQSQEAERNISIPQVVNDSSPLDLAMQASISRARESTRQGPRRYRFDSFVPTACGQEGEVKFPPDDPSRPREEHRDLRKVSSRRDPPAHDTLTKALILDATDDAQDESPGAAEGETAVEPAEGASALHGACRYSRYLPCRHNDLPQETAGSRSPSTAKVDTVSHWEVEKGLRKDVTAKDIQVDHGPCTFNKYQPCSHVTHTACQFDRYRPCQHEECERDPTLEDSGMRSNHLPHSTAKATNPSLCRFDRYHPCQHEEVEDGPSEGSDTAAVKKSAPSARPGGYKYNSRSLREKLGQHSPCVFDRYKPCLHEECVGAGAGKHRAGLSLLANVSKSSARHDTKMKAKESIHDPFQCKFTPYKPCIHEEEVKFNRALGRKASIRPEKPKARPAELTATGPQEGADVCKFSRFKPCFCQDTIEASNAEKIQTLDRGDAEQRDAQSITHEDKKLVTGGRSSPVGQEKRDGAAGDTGWPNAGALASSRDRRAGGELSDGPSLRPSIAAAPSPAKNSVGAGDGADGGQPKDEGDDDVKGVEGPETSGAMSLMTRLSRAWFSSAQAQVSRLTPPSPARVMVNPSLRPCGGLESSVDGDARLVAGIAAVAATYTPMLQQPGATSAEQPQARPVKRSAPEAGSSPRDSEVTAPRQAARGGGDRPAWAQHRLYELSLAESRTGETCDLDVSQLTDMPDPSGWTLSRGPTLPDGGSAAPVTEPCSGQIWRQGRNVPEDFLVLTSNLYPVSPGAGDSGRPGRAASKWVDAGLEVQSADPLPVHFSDVARAGGRPGGGPLLREKHEKLYTGQAGVTLCQSSWTGHEQQADDGGNQGRRVARLLRERRAPGGSGPAVLEDGEDVTHEMDVSVGGEKFAEEFTTRGDVSANPLVRHRRCWDEPCDMTNVLVGRSSGADSQAAAIGKLSDGVDNSSPSLRLDGLHGGSDINTELREAQGCEAGGCDVSADTDRADLSSKERRAAVVAAAELASYKTLLDTIHKIARVEPRDSGEQTSTLAGGAMRGYRSPPGSDTSCCTDVGDEDGTSLSGEGSDSEETFSGESGDEGPGRGVAGSQQPLNLHDRGENNGSCEDSKRRSLARGPTAEGDTCSQKMVGAEKSATVTGFRESSGDQGDQSSKTHRPGSKVVSKNEGSGNMQELTGSSADSQFGDVDMGGDGGHGGSCLDDGTAQEPSLECRAWSSGLVQHVSNTVSGQLKRGKELQSELSVALGSSWSEPVRDAGGQVPGPGMTQEENGAGETEDGEDESSQDNEDSSEPDEDDESDEDEEEEEEDA